MRTSGSVTPLRLVIWLALFAIPAFLTNHLAKSTIADANRDAGFENIPANVRDIDASQSLYRAENFRAALTALEERAGKSPELLHVGVMPHMAEFQVRDGRRARGYRYYAKNREMDEFKIRLVGPGSLEGSQFPYRAIGAGASENLVARVAREDPALRVTNMTIRRIGTELKWSVDAESDERTGVVFRVAPDALSR